MKVEKIRTEVEKIRVGVNKKVMLGLFSIFMCLALIIVCSFVPFVIKPEKWQTNEFLTDELIICAIVVMSMVSVMFIGQASNAQNENSRIAKSRVSFFESLKIVIERNINAFRQWVRKRLQPEDVKTIKERRLRNLGIDDVLILELDDHQLSELMANPQKYAIPTAENELDRKGRYFKRITPEQYKGILEIKKTEYSIRFVEPEYYLSVKNLTDTRTVSERAVNEGKKKTYFLSSSIFSKLLITIVSAMIFASLVRDLSQEVDQAAAWAKFVSRVWAMISSAFMGYMVGTQMNDIDAEYIEMRVQVHTRYLQDTEFKPISQQEEAKKEFVERVKEEQVLRIEEQPKVEEEEVHPLEDIMKNPPLGEEPKVELMPEHSQPVDEEQSQNVEMRG